MLLASARRILQTITIESPERLASRTFLGLSTRARWLGDQHRVVRCARNDGDPVKRRELPPVLTLQ